MSLIAYVTKIHFAENVLEDALEAELELLGMNRPMIVCDHAPRREHLLERLLAAIPRTRDATLYRVGAEGASEASCSEAADLYDSCGADGLISFGEEAAINLAKGLGVRVSHAGPLTHYVGTGGGKRIRDVSPPLIAIPTIPNSCAEALGVTRLRGADGAGMMLNSQNLLPRVVICDPTLSLDLDPVQTASSGMDALTHCLETFIATAYNPPADGIARDGIHRASFHIERAVEDGSDLTARRELMAAALNGALASQKGLGGVHAMSHAVAALLPAGVDHGAVNAVLLPLLLDFNEPAVAERYDVIRQEMGMPAHDDLAEEIARLRDRLGLPGRLTDLGFRACDVDRAAALASDDFCNRTNPRRAATEDYRALFLRAL